MACQRNQGKLKLVKKPPTFYLLILIQGLVLEFYNSSKYLEERDTLMPLADI